jgi:hypothetical protein
VQFENMMLIFNRTDDTLALLGTPSAWLMISLKDLVKSSPWLVSRLTHLFAGCDGIDGF